MSYTKESLEKNQVKFTFEVSEQDWKSAIDKAYNKMKGKFQIGGFRKGHAPKKVIESMYGAGVFFEDALDIVITDYYSKALEENSDLFPVARPEIDVLSISDTQAKFTATVQLKPEVKLGKYTGLEFKKDKVSVSKAEIQVEIDAALDRVGAWEKVEDAVANGDKTVIDFSGSIDGVKFEGGTAEKHELEIGSGTFIPGFEEQIVGMKIGENKDIVVTFPDDYGAKELAGKQAVFAVTLHDATRKILPKYDDEFVKDVSEFDSVADYEANIKSTIMKKKEEEANYKLENDMAEKITELATVDVPECMVVNEAEKMVDEFEYRLMYQGFNKEDYYKYTSTNRESMVKKYMENAAKNVKIQLVLEAVMKEIKIPVSQEEIDKSIEEYAVSAGKTLEEMKKNITESQMDYFRNNVTSTKFFEYLKNNNTIK